MRQVQSNAVTGMWVLVDFASDGKYVVGRGSAGMTYVELGCAERAARFFQENQASAVPAWRRLRIVAGKLVLMQDHE